MILTDNDDVKCINDVIMTSFLILPNHFCHFEYPLRINWRPICCIGLQPIRMQLKSDCNQKRYQQTPASVSLFILLHRNSNNLWLLPTFLFYSKQSLWCFEKVFYWTAISVHCPPVCKILIFFVNNTLIGHSFDFFLF